MKLLNEAKQWTQELYFLPFFSAMNLALRMKHIVLKNKGKDLLHNVKYSVCWVLPADIACKKLVYPTHIYLIIRTVM